MLFYYVGIQFVVALITPITTHFLKFLESSLSLRAGLGAKFVFGSIVPSHCLSANSLGALRKHICEARQVMTKLQFFCRVFRTSDEHWHVL